MSCRVDVSFGRVKAKEKKESSSDSERLSEEMEILKEEM